MEPSENIKFLINGNDESGTLSLTDSISIQDSECLRQTILEAFDSTQSVNINVEGLNSIDLSGIQILYSAFETAKNLKKNVSISGDFPDNFKKDIESAGFNHFNWLCHSGQN